MEQMAAAGRAALTAGFAFATIGATILGVSGYLAEFAAHFDSDMTLLHTHANVATADIGVLREGILQLAPAIGVGPDALSQALFRVESHMTSLGPQFQSNAAALDILTRSTQLAKIGHADLETTTVALSNVLAAYGKDNLTAAQAAGVLNNTVGEGNMRLQQLVTAFATGILPVAEQAGLKIQSLGAALATMTDLGVPAQRAATYLRSAIIQMTMPSGPAVQALEAIGVAGDDVIHQMGAFSEILQKAGINQSAVAVKLRQTGSLAETMTFLRDKMMEAGATAPEVESLINRAFGGIRSGTGVITLYDNLNGLITKERDATTGAQNFDQTWQYYVSHDPTFAIDRLHSGFDTLATVLGQAMIPAMMGFIAFVLPLITQATQWVDQNQALVASIILFVGIGSVAIGIFLLMAGAIAMAVAAIGAIAGIFAPLLIVIGAMTQIAVYAAIVGVVFRDDLGPAFKTVWQDVQNFVGILRILWETALPYLQMALRDVVDSVHAQGGLFDTLQQSAKEFQRYITSQEFAQIIAVFIVMIPIAINVTVLAFRVAFDYINIIIIGFVALVKIAHDAATGNFEAMAADSVRAGQQMGQAAQRMNTDIQNSANGQANALRDLDNSYNTVTSQVWAMMNNVGAAADTGYGDGRRLGDGLGRGIVDGFNAQMAALNWAMRQGIGNAYETGLETGLIASPSRLTYRIGEALGQGLVVGVDDQEVDLQNSIENIISRSASVNVGGGSFSNSVTQTGVDHSAILTRIAVAIEAMLVNSKQGTSNQTNIADTKVGSDSGANQRAVLLAGLSELLNVSQRNLSRGVVSK